MASTQDGTEVVQSEDDPGSKAGDDVSSGICESDDGGKCDSATDDFLSAEDDEQALAPEDYDLSVSSSGSHLTKATSLTDSSAIDMASGSSDVLESAVNLANGIRILNTTQEENWKKINDLISKKDNLIKEMTELVRNVKEKMSSTTLSSRDSEGSNLCVSCSKPLYNCDFHDVRITDAIWTKHPVDFIEELFHVDDDWKCVNEADEYDTDTASGNGDWNLEDEEEKESAEDLFNLDFTKITVPKGFENSPRQESTDIS